MSHVRYCSLVIVRQNLLSLQSTADLVATTQNRLIDGEAPILRERDTITPETANTPAKRLIFPAVPSIRRSRKSGR